MRSVDILVIGGGPAGMTAATAACRAGLSVALIDERPSAGGQIYRGLEDGPFRDRPSLGDDYLKGQGIVKAFRSASMESFFGASLWRIDAGEREGLAVFTHLGKQVRVLFKKLIVATGAMERPVPFAGWTLPGVMSVGGAQLLLKGSGIAPSGQIVLAGNGPLLLLFYRQLRQLDVHVSAILDTAPGLGFPGLALRHAKALFANRGKVLKGLGLIATRATGKTPVYRDVSTLRAVGTETLSSIHFVARGKAYSLDADVLLIHEGVIPNTQLSRALACKHIWDDGQACFRPDVDNRGRTSHRNIFIIGDGASIRGADAAPISAEIAVGAIIEDFGRATSDSRRKLSSALRRLKKEESFRPLLDALYPSRLAMKPLSDETIVCRCEEVSAGAVRTAVHDGAIGPAQAKAFTRCGMGSCQGRMCGLQVSRLIAEETGMAIADVGAYNIRFPLTPLPLGAMAASAEKLGIGENHAS